jgi:hypothetical protein
MEKIRQAMYLVAPAAAWQMTGIGQLQQFQNPIYPQQVAAAGKQ